MASLFASLIAWTEEAFGPWGAAGLFVLAFVESSFFPIPPDVLLVAFTVARPDTWWWHALVATAGSVLGALLGHALGRYGGRPLLLRVAGEASTTKVEAYFARYGNGAIAIAAFTPVPYKVFTIAAGALRHSRRDLVLVSIPARGARFFLVGALASVWGAEAVALLDAYALPATALFLVGLALYVGRHRLRAAVARSAGR